MTVEKALTTTFTHPDDMLAIVTWLSNEVREREGTLLAIPAGWERQIPRPNADVLREKTKVLHAQLKPFPRNAFSGVTPGTLRLYDKRKVPLIQRSEAEVQAPWDEAYPDGANV